MDVLPTELLFKILHYACDDDGQMARTLMLTCSCFNAIVDPFRFRRVAVRGLGQMVGFMNCLESLPEHRRRVESLYLSVQLEEESSPSDVPQFLVDAYVEERDTRMYGAPAEEISSYEEQLVQHIVHRILKAVAPSVRVLYIAYWNREPVFFADNLPLLEELSMEGDFEADYPLHQEPLPALPNLRRVHMYTRSGLPESVAMALSDLSPFLTHLRIIIGSSISWYNVQGLLQKILGASDSLGSAGSNEHRFPHTLQKIVLYPGRLQPPGMCGNAYMSYSMGLRSMRAFVSRSEGKVVMHEPIRWNEKGKFATSEAGFNSWMNQLDGDTSGDWVV